MRYLNLSWLRVVMVLLLAFLLVGVVAGQDLNQKKQELIRKISEIDQQLKAGATGAEREDLMKERERLVAAVSDINKKMMADAEMMKRINAVKKAYNDGNNAFKLGQLQEALNYYNKAISLDSTFYKAYYGRGLTLKKMRRYAEAIKSYQAAIRQNPNFAEAYFALGKIYSGLNKPNDAIKTYELAIKNNPSLYKAYYELGAVYLNKKKNYRKAAENFRKATQINPEYDLAFYSLGVSLTELGQFGDAIMALENALAVTKRKKWADPYYRLAVIYNKQGKYSKAKAAAAEALKNKRNYAPAAYEAGKASKDLGQYNEALNYFRIAARNRVWKRAAEYEIDLIQNRDKYGGN